jgi:hypothetical protein
VPSLAGDIAYEHLHRYALAAQLAADKVVLDVASGEGYGSALLARTARAVIGIDVDPEAVAHANQAYPRSNLIFRVGTCWGLPVPDGSVDLVVSFETLEHHDRHVEMMAEVRRVLRPDGAFVCSTPDRVAYSDLPGYKNPYHVRELTAAQFDGLLALFFAHRRLYGQRMVWGSVIGPLGADGDAPFASSGGSCADVRSEPGLARARYLIGVGWNGSPPPPIPCGVFEGDGMRTDGQLHAVALQQEVDRLAGELRQREAGCAELQAHLEAEAAKAQALDAEKAALAEAVAALRGQVAQRDQALHESQLRLQAVEATAAQSAADKDSAVAALQGDLQAARQGLAEQATAAAAVRAELAARDQRVGELERQSEDARGRAAQLALERDQTIAAVQAQLLAERERVARLTAERDATIRTLQDYDGGPAPVADGQPVGSAG